MEKMTCGIPEISLKLFYRSGQLATETGTLNARSLLSDGRANFAQISSGQEAGKILLAVDAMQSVLGYQSDQYRQKFNYQPYGFSIYQPTVVAGFNGQARDQVTEFYLLGAGYRAFSPGLMRFNSPDSWSPFGKGGWNSYAYVSCEPINHSDPTGHIKYPQRQLSLKMPKAQAPDLPPRPQSAPVLKVLSLSRSASNASSLSGTSTSSNASKVSTPRSGSYSSQISWNSSASSSADRGWKWAKNQTPQFKELKPAEQNSYDVFKNAIYHFGMSPKDAAMLAGGGNYKLLGDTANKQFQVRIGGGQRVSGTYNDRKEVSMLYVGGHT